MNMEIKALPRCSLAVLSLQRQKDLIPNQREVTEECMQELKSNPPSQNF